MRDGHRRRVRCEGKRKPISGLRPSAIACGAGAAILHDIHRLAADNQTSDRDVGPARIGIQRRPGSIKRRANASASRPS